MFELEQTISVWRREMLAAGVKTPVPLEELERHLREAIERQMKSGTSAEKAFEISVRQMGGSQILNREFEKTERTIMKKPLIILVGILAVLVGTAMIMPAAHLYKEQGM